MRCLVAGSSRRVDAIMVTVPLAGKGKAETPRVMADLLHSQQIQTAASSMMNRPGFRRGFSPAVQRVPVAVSQHAVAPSSAKSAVIEAKSGEATNGTAASKF